MLTAIALFFIAGILIGTSFRFIAILALSILAVMEVVLTNYHLPVYLLAEYIIITLTVTQAGYLIGAFVEIGRIKQ